MSLKIEKYDARFESLFRNEMSALKRALPHIEFFHIGSTAIKGCDAKPILDILGVVNDITTVTSIEGYDDLGAYGIPHRRFFRKSGEVHLHIFEDSDPQVARHLRFVAYMNCHPNEVKGYSELKHKLAQECTHINQYTLGKSAFVKEIDTKAVAKMGLWPHHNRRRKEVWSEWEMKEAMRINVTSFFGYYAPYTPLLEAPFEPDIALFNSDIPHDEFNNVFDARFENGERIQHVTKQFNHPFSWWIYDLDTPVNLDEQLVAHGYHQKGEVVGMVAPIESYPEATNKIERVLTHSQLKTFFHLHNPTPIFNPLIESLSPHLIEEGAPMEIYLLYEKGKPVTTGIAYFHANVVGIYYLLTEESHRKKGYAKQMMHHLLNRAKSLGYHLATLQSSKMGQPLYTQLGFTPLSTYKEFTLPLQTHQHNPQ